MRTKFRTCLLIIGIQLLNYLSAQEAFKRGPQGFVGMRGKKYSEEREFFKRKPQFFVGVKGKKNFDDLEESYYKRAPMGFVGMRGKKSFDELPESGSLIGQIDYTADRPNYEYLKQMIASYIHSLATPDPYSIEYPNFSADEDNGTSAERNEIDKRANLKQFYGVRGKKSVQNKRPFDLNFRGKFIGVRGKKDPNMKEIKFLLEHSEPWPKRKGQMSGFFGMRGKKWTDDSTEEEAE